MSTHSIGGGSGSVGGHRGVFGKGNKPADKLPKATKPEATPLRDVFERVQVARDLFAPAAAKPALGSAAGLEPAQHGAGAVGGGNIAAAFDVEELVGLKPGDGAVRGGNIAAAFDVEELLSLKPDPTVPGVVGRLGVPPGVTKKA